MLLEFSIYSFLLIKNKLHKKEIKLNNKEPATAPKKLVTLNPGTKPARENKSPLSITVKIPNVNILNGKVTSNKNGFIKVFISPMTAAVINNTKKPSRPLTVISNPLIIFITKNKDIVFISHFIAKFLKFIL